MAARKTLSRGSKPDKKWRDAISLAVNEAVEHPTDGSKVKKLRLLADKLVERALDGDMAAIREIGDRLDGRPAQALLHGSDTETPGPIMIVTGICRDGDEAA
jgi:ribosomal protein L17